MKVEISLDFELLARAMKAETEAAFERAWLDCLRTGFGVVTLNTDSTGKPGALLPGAFYD